jgi:DNA mismatch endonuclease (patch repair protein)
MSRIKNKNTKAEILVRKKLHSLGFRFRLNNKAIFGNPDIVLPKYRTALFVNGCFWHRHEKCKYAYMPKSKVEFWEKKFTANIKRDVEVSKQLSDSGWKQFVIWECETKNSELLTEIIKNFF